MEKVTIGTKNQIVIPKTIRSQIAGLKPGRQVRVYSRDKHTVMIKVDEKSWLESGYGLMKKAWAKVDPLRKLEESRNEW